MSADPGNAQVLGLGLATPEGRIEQARAAELACRLVDVDSHALLTRLFERCGVGSRGAVVVGPEWGGGTFYDPAHAGRNPTTAHRMAAYEALAPALSVRAGSAALRSCACDAGSITHLVTASCTGFSSPGVDTELVVQLGLSPGVQRTHLGFMGCHAAINALRAASAFVRAEPSSRVLVCCVELCTLHFDASGRPDGMVANALFADGAASCVVGRAERSVSPRPELRATGSLLAPDSRDAMTWRISDHGFPMTLSARVPDLIASHLRRWLGEWLATLGRSREEIRGWGVHPGGPRILDAAEDALGLSRGGLVESREVLRAHGNMSSPTVLFILDRLITAGKLPAVVLAFGPGLTIEAMLIER